MQQTTIFESALQDRKRGDMSVAEYNVFMAVQAARNPRVHAPSPYATMTPYLSLYIDRRISGSDRYDPALARQLGDWIYSIVKAREENDGTWKLLCWAWERLQEKGYQGELERVSAMLDVYQRLAFPAEPFRKALRVQALDSRERQRTARPPGPRD